MNRDLVSFVVPAHDEAAHLPGTLRAIHEAAREVGLGHEAIVACDACTDGTEGVAREHGARVVSHARRQISATRNLGARAAGGRVLIFVDADTLVTPGAVGAAMRSLGGGAVGGGASVRFDGRVPLYARALLPAFNWSFRVMRLAGGCFVFCTREALERVGGWDETLFVGEEIELARALKGVGRFEVVREHVVTSGRKVRTHGARDLIGILARGAIGWRRMASRREGLELWYGPRRVDPDGPAAGSRREGCEGGLGNEAG